MVRNRTLALPASIIDGWSHKVQENVSHVVEVSGFVHFTLSFDGQKRVVAPRHYIIAFPHREKGRLRHHSALLTLQVVHESTIRDVAPGSVANHLRFQSTSNQKHPAAEEYVEFELLSRAHEAPAQQPLRITAGPVRVNEKTGQKESRPIDLGQCIRMIATDVVEDERKQKLVRNRWWICIETLRLVCVVNSLDSAALDTVGATPLEWVIRLVDSRAPVNEAEQPEERNIDDLVKFIGDDNKKDKEDSAKGKGAKKKKGKNDEIEDVSLGAGSADFALCPTRETIPGIEAVAGRSFDEVPWNTLLGRLRQHEFEHSLDSWEPTFSAFLPAEVFT